MEQDTRALQEELKRLRQEFVELKGEVSKQQRFQLLYSVDKNTQSVLKNTLHVQLPDELWFLLARRYMQYSSTFEFVNTTGSANIAGWFVLHPTEFTAGPKNVFLSTTAVAGDENELIKGIVSTGVEIFYYNRARVRFIFGWNSLVVTGASTKYLTVGSVTADEQYWGFKIVSDGTTSSVYGVAFSSFSPGGEQTVLLYKDTGAQVQMARGEAVLVPGLGINFYLSTGFDLVTGLTSGKPINLGQGIIANPIPPSTPKGAATDILFYLSARNDDAAVAELVVSFCEFTTELQIPL